MALSGTDYNAFTGDVIIVGLGTPGTYQALEVGIFDGESGGMWDFSAAALEYTLFADSSGDGRGSIEVGRWIGSSMPDNAWYTITVANVDAAKARNGNYVYYMRIRSTDTSIKSTSSFKMRTNGTIAIKSHQAFAIYAPLTKEADARVIYPQYPSITTSTYDGTWKLYVDVPIASTNMTIWDGDMDFGSFDGSAMDTDDGDTPNSLPEWATASAVNEGNATSSWTIRDPNRPGSTIKMSGDPADDNQNQFYRRNTPITYELVDPAGRTFVNLNPSGNLEWEQFRLDTAPFDATKMDYHVDSVPIGIYEIRVTGMDMGNVNSWRFFNELAGTSSLEVLGVDSAGRPVAAYRAPSAADRKGDAEGVVFFDSDADGAQDAGEPGIANVDVTLLTYEASGSKKVASSMKTDAQGAFKFGDLAPSTYAVEVSNRSLPRNVEATLDADGAATPNSTSFAITSAGTSVDIPFGYQPTVTVGTRTRGYWSNHASKWPVDGMFLGDVWYTKTQALAILNEPSLGDRTLALAAQLIATKLNLARGSDATCIGSFVAAADAWLTLYPVGTGNSIGCDWHNGEPIHIELDDYNNGELCAPHED